jgi:proteic killer suppression protein
VIRSFKNRIAERLYQRQNVPELGTAQRAGLRKLVMLAAATQLVDLAQPPGNRLEALLGDRSGQHSTRINDRWRICFRWRGGGAEEVEIVDYH